MRTPTPRLLPGLVAVRRSRTEWQVGLRRPVRVPDSPQVRRAVDETTGQLVRAVDGGLIDDLDRRGALLDPAASAVLRPAYGTLVERRRARDLAALVLRHGREAARAVRARGHVVAVRCHGPAAEDVAAEVDRLLREVGSGGLVRDDDAPLVLLVSDGEPPRDLADDLLRRRVPHLVLRLLEGAVLLGPFVQPGLTACLRCEDLHRGETDPAWPLLVAQAARLGARARADDVATPVDALTAGAAAAMAARDLLRALEGVRPGTWSSELRWGPDDPAPGGTDVGLASRPLLRHAACACGCWDVAPTDVP